MNIKQTKQQLLDRITELQRQVDLLHSNLNLGNSRNAGFANKIYLIKMIRSAQHQFGLDLAAGKTLPGQGCMGLAESKAFVEKYLEENLKP